MDIILATSSFGYILSYDRWSYDKICGHLYEISRDVKENPDDWKCSLLFSMPGIPIAAHYTSSGEIYIVTTEAIMVMNADKSMSTLVEYSAILKAVGANSIVFYDDSVWCGMDFGLYRYNIVERKEEWYWVDWE